MIKISRRKFLSAAGIAGASVALDATAIEPQRVVVTRHELNSAGSRANDPTVTVVQLTDLHLQRVGRHAHRIAEAVNRLQPQLLLITGDSIDEDDRIDVLSEFMALLDPGPVKLATLGNWEHWARIDIDGLRSTYGAHGCKLLINESVKIRFREREAMITGLDDWTAGQPDLASSLRGMSPHANHWYREANPPLYVSRGLGTSVAPIRFGSAPEIAHFRWRLAGV
jgi:uncharacterized protein